MPTGAVDQLMASGLDEASARAQVQVPVPGSRISNGTSTSSRATPAPGPMALPRGGTKYRPTRSRGPWPMPIRRGRNWLASLSGQRAGRRVGYPRFKKKGRSRDSVRLGSIRLHSSSKRRNSGRERCTRSPNISPLATRLWPSRT